MVFSGSPNTYNSDRNTDFRISNQTQLTSPPSSQKEKIQAFNNLYFSMLTRLEHCCCRPKCLQVAAHLGAEMDTCEHSPASSIVRMLCPGDVVAKAGAREGGAWILGISCTTLQKSLKISEFYFFIFKMKTRFLKVFFGKMQKNMK